VVDALRASADQEFAIAERLAGKARQAFALGAGVYVVAQTVAFGNFEATKLSSREQHWIIYLAILAVLVLGVAALATIKADAPVDSRDLPLTDLATELNAAYDGDPDVVGRLGGYYLGVVRSRRGANAERRRWYAWARGLVSASLVVTTAELIFALLARAT
jgi:cytochrome c biogenesis protein CcdA